MLLKSTGTSPAGVVAGTAGGVMAGLGADNVIWVFVTCKIDFWENKRVKVGRNIVLAQVSHCVNKGK